MEDSIIVVEAGIPVGIITTKDIFRILSSGSATDLPLAEYMTSPVATTHIDATIHDALMQLKTLKIKRAVVVDANRHLVGVVTQSELVGFAYGTWIDLVKHHASELKELVGILESKALGLEKSALTDPLTGIGNRRMLQQRLEEEIQRIRRYRSSPFSLLLIDIDHFKRVNDSHGHLVGDEVLKLVAASCAAWCGPSTTSLAGAAKNLRCCCRIRRLPPRPNLLPACGWPSRIWCCRGKYESASASAPASLPSPKPSRHSSSGSIKRCTGPSATAAIASWPTPAPRVSDMKGRIPF